MSIKEISFQQIQVFYRSEGKGHPVLLLHGFGEDGRIWEGLCGHLPAHYHWLIPDIPGSGRSPALPGNPAIEDWAAVGKAICEAEQIDRCTVLGHSMGGYIALAMTELYPTMVNGLGLVHSTAFPDSEAKKEARSKSIAFIEAHGAMAFLRTSIPGLFSPGYAAANPSTVEELVENGHSFTPTALIQYYKAMIHRPDRTAVLQNADVPILVLAGEQDMAVPFAQSQQQAYLAKETHVQYLRHSAHLGMLEEPDRFHEAISQFLADVHREK